MEQRPDEPSPAVPDDAWAEIVARLEAPDGTTTTSDAGTGAAPRPGSGPVAPPRTSTEGRTVRPARTRPGDAPARPSSGPGSTGRDWDATEQFDAAEAQLDEHEGFVPPDPGPVLGGDPLRTAAWTAVVVCPLVVLVALVVGSAVPSVLVQASGIVLLLAIAVLLWRMPHRRDPGDRDDGAVV